MVAFKHVRIQKVQHHEASSLYEKYICTKDFDFTWHKMGGGHLFNVTQTGGDKTENKIKNN